MYEENAIAIAKARRSTVDCMKVIAWFFFYGAARSLPTRVERGAGCMMMVYWPHIYGGIYPASMHCRRRVYPRWVRVLAGARGRVSHLDPHIHSHPHPPLPAPTGARCRDSAAASHPMHTSIHIPTTTPFTPHPLHTPLHTCNSPSTPPAINTLTPDPQARGAEYNAAAFRRNEILQEKEAARDRRAREKVSIE